MSTVGSPLINDHYSIDGIQNCNIKREESVEAFLTSDSSAVKLPIQLQFECDAAGTKNSSYVMTDFHQTDDDLDGTDVTLQTEQPVEAEAAKSPKGTQTLGGSLSWATSPVVSGISYSRFRIVKIESRDRCHRGRWTCHDFADPPEHIKTEQTVKSDSGLRSTNTNRPSIYYIPGVQDALRSPFGIVYQTGGHPVLEANFLASPKYAHGSRFFASSLPTLNNTSEDVSQSEMMEVNLSSQGVSTVDQPELVGHSAARKLFPDCENDTLMPLKITVSLPVENGSQNVKGSESFYVRQSSTSMLTAADVAQKTTGQSSPLDIMMSATLGSSSSEQELRLVVVFLPLFAMNTL